MRKSRIFVLVLLLVLLGGGIYLWRLPAEVGYRLIAARIAPASLSGLHGTVWDGHADGLSVLGNDLGALDWHLSKGSLLAGKPLFDLRIAGSDLELAGAVERREGSLRVQDLRFTVPAQRLQGLLENADISLRGSMSGTLATATLSRAGLADVRGDALWRDAVIATPRAEIHLSGLSAEFSTQSDGSIAGTFKDDGSSALAVDGNFVLRQPNYEAQATLRARNADAEVEQLLLGIGERQADGSTRVQAQGSLLRMH